MIIPLLGRTGLKIRAGDGYGELGFPEMLSTPVYYRAFPGSRLSLCDEAYKFNVATYRPEIDHSWIYTYTYAPEQSWTIYNNDLSGDSYRQADYVFSSEVYFRICIRKVNGELFDGTEDINDILVYNDDPQEVQTMQATQEHKPWINAEASRAIDRANTLRQTGDLVFILLADSHYNVNGTWDDTQEAIRLLSNGLKLDGVIHLGDITDGMVTSDATRYYASIVLGGLKNNDVPVWVTLGNHDSNYFRRNPEYFSTEEQCNVYLDGDCPRYYNDITTLRLIFLDSFDPGEPIKYGYTDECTQWLDHTLENMTPGSKAIILSHLPPVKRLQYWTNSFRGEDEITGLLRRHREKLLAWINGHNHADMLDNNEGYPAISIVNSKCEAFTEHKTEGFITPDRKLNDASQEAFDIIIVNPLKETIRFIRFGAGSDRIVADGKAQWAPR